MSQKLNAGEAIYHHFSPHVSATLFTTEIFTVFFPLQTTFSFVILVELIDFTMLSYPLMKIILNSIYISKTEELKTNNVSNLNSHTS